MTKREREGNAQSDSQVNGPCLERPATAAQIPGTHQTGSLPVGFPIAVDEPTTGEGVAQAATSAVCVSETSVPDEVANEVTAATLEGDYGPFWALLARAGYTIW